VIRGGEIVERMPTISRLQIEKGFDNHDQVTRVLASLPELEPETVVAEEGGSSLPAADMQKTTLRLIPFHGRLLKTCPGTKGYICCGYQILHVGTNCSLDCSYCILQGYLNQPALRVFINLADRLPEIGRIMDRYPERIFRVGTGEFTDSLALDSLTYWTEILLPFFEERRNALLELKTKTTQVEGLLRAKARDRIVVSWSLNSPAITSREEQGAPSIKARLEAARRCQQEGYAIGIHFDPLVEHPNWQTEYARTLDLMEKHLDPNRVIWVSLGCLRFMPALGPIIRKRHPHSRVLNGEFVPGRDGKLRYFKPIRVDMYGTMGRLLRAWHRDLGVYLCMESREVWQQSLGWSPEDSAALSSLLDQRFLKFFGMPKCYDHSFKHGT
jgi:spore photoproduct lyase